MMRTTTIAVVLSLSACADWAENPDGFTDTDRALIAGMVLPGTPPADPTNAVANNVSAVHLGHRLFFDTELSNPTGMSCAGCHNPNAGFMDNRSKPNNISQGVDPLDGGSPPFTKRNSLGLLDVAFYGWWGWDGRSDSLWMQCGVAYELGTTMAGTRARLRRAIAARHADEYFAAFPQGTSPFVLNDFPGGYDAGIDDAVAANAYKSMAAYLTQLVYVDAPFDLYAAGDDQALPPDAKRGLKLFLGDAGCITCHNGPALNGAAEARSNEDFFRTVGIGQRGGAHVVADDDGWQSGITNLNKMPLATLNSAGPFNDAPGLDRATPLKLSPPLDARGKFRIKGLRNVALTAPYMHAGQLSTLDDVVHFYNGGGDDSGFDGTRDRQLQPLGLSESQLSDLVSFLESLTGKPTPLVSLLMCDPLKQNDAGIAPCDGGYP